MVTPDKDTLDFIVIGAMKSGTTSVFEHLRQHPEIALPPDKEAPFFSHDDAYRRGWRHYLDRGFLGADPAMKWGSVTGQYLVGGLWEQASQGGDPRRYGERTVPLRIRQQLPSVRLIAVLRDPVARARSYHRMAVMNGWETRPFQRAVDDLLTPEALADARRVPRQTTGYVAWGEYGRLLAGYFDVFPREQLLVVFTADLEQGPEAFMRRLFEFIGVRKDFVAPDVAVRYRAGADRPRVRGLGFQSPLNPWSLQRTATSNPAARRLWHSLPDRARHRLDRGFARMAYQIDLWNRSPATAPPEIDAVTLQRLREHYESDTRLLASLLGAELPWQSRSD